MDDFSLRVFYKLAQLKNFSKVAEELYITPSAVSRQIKNMEDKLGVKLCLREREGISLTEEGKILLEHVAKIIALYEKVITEIDHFRHTSLKKIIIGASTTLCEYLLPKIISTFGKKYPEADIYLRVANTNEILKQLSTNAFNLAVVEAQFDNPSFIVEKVFEDELALIVSNRHLWASKEQINFNEVLSEPIIIREQGSGTRKMLESALANFGVELSDLKVKMELDSTEAIKNAVGENLGVAFISKATLIKIPEMIKIVPVTNMEFRFDFNLIYSKEKGFTSLTLEFIEVLKENLSNQYEGKGVFGSCL